MRRVIRIAVVTSLAGTTLLAGALSASAVGNDRLQGPLVVQSVQNRIGSEVAIPVGVSGNHLIAMPDYLVNPWSGVVNDLASRAVTAELPAPGSSGTIVIDASCVTGVEKYEDVILAACDGSVEQNFTMDAEGYLTWDADPSLWLQTSGNFNLWDNSDYTLGEGPAGNGERPPYREGVMLQFLNAVPSPTTEPTVDPTPVADPAPVDSGPVTSTPVASTPVVSTPVTPTPVADSTDPTANDAIPAPVADTQVPATVAAVEAPQASTSELAHTGTSPWLAVTIAIGASALGLITLAARRRMAS